MYNQDVNKITTGRVVLHYPHIQEKWAFNKITKPKHCLQIIILQDDMETLEKIKTAINEADERGREIYRHTIGEDMEFISPLKEPKLSNTTDTLCMDNYSMNASTEVMPTIFNKNKEEIIKSDDYMEGRYARVSISFHPYCFNGKYGVSCKLYNIQLFEEKFDIRKYMPNPADDF